MLIRAAEIPGCGLADIRCQGGRIAAIAEGLEPVAGERVLDAGGGAVLPGLHDHHIHLLASAAARMSVRCGPPEVDDRPALVSALRSAASGGGWIRGVGYHESVAGLPDRWQLDQIVADQPLRLQHRSGKMWLLNSAAVAELELSGVVDDGGVERDSSGRATGRLFRMDAWLGRRLRQIGGASELMPHLAAISARLASCGVTGVTDAGAGNDGAVLALLTAAMQSGRLRQSVLLLGRERLPMPCWPGLDRGAVKILLDDHRLPAFDALWRRMARAHQCRRPVAVHCVTATELVFALSALEEAGAQSGDRIEHASVTPYDSLRLLRRAGVSVVTQPAFIYQRGDQYRRDVPLAEHPQLYRGHTFLAHDIPLAGSSDAPYGDLDPWLGMRAAVRRLTRDGAELAGNEALNPEQALALYTGRPESPGRRQRRVSVGEPASLCVLDRPWRQARLRLSADDVAATIGEGRLIYQRDNPIFTPAGVTGPVT